MPRAPREDFEGAWHHVFNRGSARRTVFDDETDYRLFMLELRDAARKSTVQVHAFCLMPNHFHLLLHTPAGGLSSMMQQLGSRFTQSSNKRRSNDGPLFRGRFKSIAVADDAQLVATARYIHLNPVEAGIVRRPELWPWSSAHAYATEKAVPDWLRIDTLAAMSDWTDLVR